MIDIAGVAYARMADSVDPHSLPPGFDAYLGYVDGRWPDYLEIAREHGNVPVFGLTVFEDGRSGVGTDTEPGDGTIAQAVEATRAEMARGVDRPIKYCPESWAKDLVDAHNLAGIPRSNYRLLTAHYGHGMHICGPQTCGCPVQADGSQWVDHGPFDESILTADFILAASHPGPEEASSPIPAPVAPPVPPKPKELPVEFICRTIEQSERAFLYDHGRVSGELSPQAVAGLKAADPDLKDVSMLATDIMALQAGLDPSKFPAQ